MIVVDTNIIAYLWLKGERTSSVKKLLKKDADWKVPFLWRSEFRNVLSLYIRKDLLTLPVAITIVKNAERQLKGNEYLVNSESILELVTQSDCSAYDCEFVALAKELGIKLITADKNITQQFPKTAIHLS